MLDVIKSQVRKFLIASTLKLAGWQAWVANIIFNVLWKKISVLVKKYQNKKETDKEVSEQLNDYKEVINDSKSSAEDVKNAGRDLING